MPPGRAPPQTHPPATETGPAIAAGAPGGGFAGSVDSLTADEASGTLSIGGSLTTADTVETSGWPH